MRTVFFYFIMVIDQFFLVHVTHILILLGCFAGTSPVVVQDWTHATEVTLKYMEKTVFWP